MTSQENNSKADDHHHYHEHHGHDMVMPGFRFHPTEEELIEFYLRRKVEGKRFNVELITFLDLYRYDPWELPALAAIGEKEWFFYVPRDRKYRNGDRPNRVTSSGYWKATGADRMIRSENLRSIGLKKTLVFYSGKAPKGIRSSWIMNEYRLPQHETERLQKAEISLCRVYKRPGVEDHQSLPHSVATRASSSRGTTHLVKNQHTSMDNFQAFPLQQQYQVDQETEKMSETSGSSSNAEVLSKHNPSFNIPPPFSSLVPNCTPTGFISGSNMSLVPNYGVADDFHRLMNSQQDSISQQQNYQNQNHQYYLSSQFSKLQPQPPHTTISDRLLWELNSITEGSNKDYCTSLFK
ncbi:hypothetical protein RHGRI_014239 [Rhododendron griersonianum]|uniref:NAC domain-containing protein n=1 Tax=Rhododendron griersonianum TaxID=479676 RepID=A0AAV6K909_9ERIC|nr:hypothetical protein RHGRI_014239 [Rhododendron griersonianum]